MSIDKYTWRVKDGMRTYWTLTAMRTNEAFEDGHSIGHDWWGSASSDNGDNVVEFHICQAKFPTRADAAFALNRYFAGLAIEMAAYGKDVAP